MANGREMAWLCLCLCLCLLFSLSLSILSSFTAQASEGDEDPKFRSCIADCRRTGCINESCLLNCKDPINGAELTESSSIFRCDPMRFKLKVWDCASECGYQCMTKREAERELEEGEQPVKYHGKWPFKRIAGLQEPASVVFSLANLAMHLHGWASFLDLVHHRLPQRSQGRKKPYYEYTNLWLIYGLVSMNSWFWSAVFHSRDVDATERLDYSSAVALIGCTLLLAIIRAFSLRTEAARVMVAAPIVAFITTHILYLNLYNFDYGLNMVVCVVIGVTQLLIWTLWAGLTRHPSRVKLWFVVLSGALAMLLEIYDFPPIWGFFDAHSLWHASTVPLTFLWWSFVKDDALFRTPKINTSIGQTGDVKKAK